MRHHVVLPLVLLAVITPTTPTTPHACPTSAPSDVSLLRSRVASVVADLSSSTGFAISVGYVDACDRVFSVADGPRDPPAFSSPSSLSPFSLAGNATPSDRFTFGSGTKGLTATAIVRAAERGSFSLSDPAYPFIDRSLAEFNTTLANLLGPLSRNVTIAHLIEMRSGISDFDVPAFDNYVLERSDRDVLTPYDILRYVSSLNATICRADEAGVCACRFQFEPGTMVSYSSTNFVLAGLVLAGVVPPPGPRGDPPPRLSPNSATTTTSSSWTRYDLASDLNLDPKRYDLVFVSVGNLSRWLDVAGDSVQYGETRLWGQDASVLGWTCGNAVGNALSMARFYYELLGPPCAFVSEENRAYMTTFRTLNEGWAAGYIDYGAGLMIQNMAPAQQSATRPALNQSASYVGHAGDTYGFLSDNGWYPMLNASVSVVVNEDTVGSDFFTCHVMQEVVRFLATAGEGVEDEDLRCEPMPEGGLHYFCEDSAFDGGGKVCVPSVSHKATMNRTACEATCGV